MPASLLENYNCKKAVANKTKTQMIKATGTEPSLPRIDFSFTHLLQ